MKRDEVAADRARVPLLTVDEMSADQRALYDEVVSGPRGEMIGPLRAALHSPELAVRWSRLGEFLRFSTCLPKRLNELAIIVTARRWSAQVEWWVHARVGIEAGLPEEIVDAILELRAPAFDDADGYEVYEFARLAQHHGRIPDAVYEAVANRWGTRGVVELSAVIGYYTMVALTLNIHELPLPDGSVPLPIAETLVELAPGQLKVAVA